jgi:K+/H+ antiporter YhaU regulatory subunit KhtT
MEFSPAMSTPLVGKDLAGSGIRAATDRSLVVIRDDGIPSVNPDPPQAPFSGQSRKSC